jgi:predicted dehydrogenase
MINQSLTVSRRRFLATASAGVTAATIVPRHVLGGAPQQTPPSETLGGALIGCGGRGGGTFGCLGPGVRRLASCDVKFKDTADDKTIYTDYRKVLERKDIEVVAVATHPGWHALISIDAMAAGKDVVCEKPMCRFISEGRAMAEAEKRYKRVFQLEKKGGYRPDKLRKLFESGLVKNCDAVVIRRGGVKVKMWSGMVRYTPEPVPPNLDWDMYCGPAPLRPYFKHRFGGSHRGYWDYEGGGLADMAHHHLHALAYQYGRDLTAPVEITPHAPPMHPEACMVWAWVELKYADGFILVLESAEWGPTYDRAKGKAPNVDELLKSLSEEDRKKFDAMPDPVVGPFFPEAVRKRVPTGSHAERSHRVAMIYHLANVAMRCGRKIKFDPVTEQVVGDEEANRLVNQPMRAPWRM